MKGEFFSEPRNTLGVFFCKPIYKIVNGPESDIINPGGHQGWWRLLSAKDANTSGSHVRSLWFAGSLSVKE